MSPPPPAPSPASARRRPGMRPGGRGDKARAGAGARWKREDTARRPPATCGATSDGGRCTAGGPFSLPSGRGGGARGPGRGRAGSALAEKSCLVSPRWALFPGRCSARSWGPKWRLHPQDPSPCLWSPRVSDTKGIFGWVLLRPSGEEKGEHLEGRSRGLGRLGGTSALSRARAPLGAGVSRGGSAGGLELRGSA